MSTNAKTVGVDMNPIEEYAKIRLKFHDTSEKVLMEVGISERGYRELKKTAKKALKALLENGPTDILDVGEYGKFQYVKQRKLVKIKASEAVWESGIHWIPPEKKTKEKPQF